MDNDIFTLVKDPKEKLKLWKDFGSAKGELICKGHSEDLCKIDIRFFNSKTESLEGEFQDNPKMVNLEEYLGHFFIGGDKYYFQARAQVTGTFVVVPVPAELYKLQRRQNFRVKIPASYPAKITIDKINNTTETLIGQLADLSSQGCRVIYKQEDAPLALNDKITGILKIADRPEVEVQGVIRHVRSEDSKKPTHTVGIEFHPLPAITESRLFAITMETHKQIFKRPS